MAVFQLIKGGRCICGAGAKSEACKCERDERFTFSFRFRGKQYTRRTDATTETKALKIERAYLRGLQGDRCDEVLAFLNGDESRMRRVCASVGELMDAYDAKWSLWLGSREAARRNVTDLALVVAYAQDLWLVNPGGRRGVKKGAEIPDLERIRKLSSTVFNEAFVNRYYMARQREAGLATDAVVWREFPCNKGFNKTLAHACDFFGEDARRHAFSGMSLPDLSSFLKAPRLPEEESEPQPFSMTEFAELCARFDALRASDPELWLLNVITRQTGMRPRYVMGLRGSWLVEGEGGRWFIELKSRHDEGFGKKKGRKGNTLNQLVPVSQAVREAILARGQGLTVGAALTKTGRQDLQKRHNALIKQVVEDEGSHGQGSYRYRDTVACVLGFLCGLEAAQRALGHKTALTTLQHYTRDLPGVSDLMRSELAAWLALPSMRR